MLFGHVLSRSYALEHFTNLHTLRELLCQHQWQMRRNIEFLHVFQMKRVKVMMFRLWNFKLRIFKLKQILATFETHLNVLCVSIRYVLH